MSELDIILPEYRELIEDYLELRRVVKMLYLSAYWSSDRLIPGVEEYIWATVKEVARITESGPRRIR